MKTDLALLTGVSVSGAFMDVIVDALMVMQARKDPDFGSQELQSYSWSMHGVAGIFGGLFGAYLTEMVSPFWCFGVTSLFGTLIFVSAIFMHKGLEVEGDYLAEQ